MGHQRAVARAEAKRDELARVALREGAGMQAAARAFGVDKGTVSRRYRTRA